MGLRLELSSLDLWPERLERLELQLSVNRSWDCGDPAIADTTPRFPPPPPPPVSSLPPPAPELELAEESKNAKRWTVGSGHRNSNPGKGFWQHETHDYPSEAPQWHQR